MPGITSCICPLARGFLTLVRRQLPDTNAPLFFAQSATADRTWVVEICPPIVLAPGGSPLVVTGYHGAFNFPPTEFSHSSGPTPRAGGKFPFPGGPKADLFTPLWPLLPATTGRRSTELSRRGNSLSKPLRVTKAKSLSADGANAVQSRRELPEITGPQLCETKSAVRHAAWAYPRQLQTLDGLGSNRRSHRTRLTRTATKTASWSTGLPRCRLTAFEQ